MKITKRQLRRIIREEQMTLNQSGVDAVLAAATQADKMYRTLQDTAGQSDVAFDDLFEEVEQMLLDLPSYLREIARKMQEQGVEGGLRENRSPLGTDEEIADKLIQKGKFGFKQRAALITALKKLDPSYKQRMSDVATNVKVGY